MYDSMHCEFYWARMANDVYTLVKDCRDCARNHAKQTRTRSLKLFPASGPLGFIAMDILEPPPKSTHENQLVVVMTDRHSKLTRAVPTTQTTALHVASIFYDHWIIPYGIPDHLLTENSNQFVSKFFATLCQFLDLKHLTTTTFHP